VGKTVASRQSSVISRQSSVASRQSSVGRRQSPVGSRQPADPSRRSPVAGRAAPEKRSTLELDRLIHERLRLGIVSALAVNERLTFNDLKRLLQTTDGNLSVHARKLEDAHYISCDKMFQDRIPRTEYRLTAAGRRALEKYVGHMEAILKAVRD
jgi:DNA-binding HxlR family transcriptional regulator